MRGRLRCQFPDKFDVMLLAENEQQPAVAGTDAPVVMWPNPFGQELIETMMQVIEGHKEHVNRLKLVGVTRAFKRSEALTAEPTAR